MGTVALVLEAQRLDEQLREAALWCDRVTLCLTAPNSDHGEVAAWKALLAAAAKLERVCVNVAIPAEGWLLHRLQETGALRLLQSETPRLRGNLLIFRRGLDARCLLINDALTSATLRSDCGAVVAYSGAADSDFARSCQRLADEWRDLAHVASGSELDRLTAATRLSPSPSLVSPAGAVEVISEAAALSRALEVLVGTLHESPSPSSARPSNDTHEHGVSIERSLPEGWSLTLRSSGTQHEVRLVDAQAQAPVVLTLRAGEDFALGNALLVHPDDGSPILAWRGGLFGSGRSQNAALWAQCCFPTLSVRHDGLGGESRVAVIGPRARAATRVVRDRDSGGAGSVARGIRRIARSRAARTRLASAARARSAGARRSRNRRGAVVARTWLPRGGGSARAGLTRASPSARAVDGRRV
jgi:hypothetical protein